MIRFTGSSSGETGEGPGLPCPLFDGTGFPLPLLRVRNEVTARGGQVKGELHDWALIHPDPHASFIQVHFLFDGDVLVEVGERGRIYVDYTEAYVPHSGEIDTTLDKVVHAILIGGYQEFVAVNEQGQWVEHGWKLIHPSGAGWGNRVFNLDVPEEQRRPTRYDWRALPAWPNPSSR